jgi:malate synthase
MRRPPRFSRGQLWQWIRNEAKLEDGTPCTIALYNEVRAAELEKAGGASAGRYGEAAAILDSLVTAHHFVEFLTLPAYGGLE